MWDAAHCDELPQGVAFILFDAIVNQGPSAAVRMLQMALGVKSDGVVGPQTISSVTPSVAAELVARRMHAYGQSLQFSRYGLGWSRRLASCFEQAIRIGEEK
jgi:lysozyme family protein